jgi:FkbM family methyltransferase
MRSILGRGIQSLRRDIVGYGRMDALRTAARRQLGKLGYELVGYNPITSIDRRRALLLEAHDITMVVDVGANKGQYGRAIRRAGYTGSLISFEPLPDAFVKLCSRAKADARWTCERMALGEEDGQTEIHVSENSASSSLLPILPSHVNAEPQSAYIASVSVPLRRLDSIAPKFLRPIDHVWMKLDVQGYELPVLRGSPNTLLQTKVIESELSLVPLYDNQVLYREMIDYLDSLGFTLVGLERGFTDTRTGHVLQVDGIFARLSA